MPVNLPLLESSPTRRVEVQNTAFAIDGLARYICSTWDEATNNGGPPFDVVVIGSGMYGAFCATELNRLGARGELRVLVLEAGPFLISEHVQNIARIGLNPPGEIDPSQDNGQARELVWGVPWRGQDKFPGVAYCVGGKSLYWGGWCPRLTEGDLAKAEWPPEVAQYLRDHYVEIERRTGVDKTTDFITGDLYDELKRAFETAAAGVPGTEKSIPNSVNGVQEAPLAVQGEPPGPGLFSFDKYSSAPLLIDALREDVAKAGTVDARRRLFLVPRAHVIRLHTADGAVTGIEVSVDGRHQTLGISRECAVVLAATTIESTRLALESFPRPHMGRNLMVHTRSDFTIRIRREAFKPLPNVLETAALLVRGHAPEGRFHLQVTASADRQGDSDEFLYRMIPDIDLLREIIENNDADWITITLRAIGEVQGKRATEVPNATGSWINLSPYEYDEFGARRAWVQIRLSDADQKVWQAMDRAALALARGVAGSEGNIQYNYDGSWHNEPHPLDRPFPHWHRGLGTTYHEAGTLWMGNDENDSVTNIHGRFHHIANAYVCDQALFPTVGSANPVLTGLTLSRRVATDIVRRAIGEIEEGFEPLFKDNLSEWRVAGRGGFSVVRKHILESRDGIGLLWFSGKQFADFVLRLDWRAFNADDNSGVFLRFPALGSGDPDNDWKLAATDGYEVQIDDRGFDPSTSSTGSALHRTGAIYELAPATGDGSRPLGQWNTFEIRAIGKQLTVDLNGRRVSELTHATPRSLRGHIGLQNHHPGSRVQFRNLRIKKL